VPQYSTSMPRRRCLTVVACFHVVHLYFLHSSLPFTNSNSPKLSVIVLSVRIVIPLTKKLKECGVFGVSSEEYLNYAVKNRAEWESHGEQVVAKMIQEARQKYGIKGPDGSIIKTTSSSEEVESPKELFSDVDTEIEV